MDQKFRVLGHANRLTGSRTWFFFQRLSPQGFCYKGSLKLLYSERLKIIQCPSRYTCQSTVKEHNSSPYQFGTLKTHTCHSVSVHGVLRAVVKLVFITDNTPKTCVTHALTRTHRHTHTHTHTHKCRLTKANPLPKSASCAASALVFFVLAHWGGLVATRRYVFHRRRCGMMSPEGYFRILNA
jgi:hypothetical protein